MEHVFYTTAKAAHVDHATEAPVIAVKYRERGYHPIFTHATPETLNEDRGWTAAEVESAVMASCFGWNTPIAKLAREAVERVEAKHKTPATRSHITFKRSNDFAGTSLQGYVGATYADLVRVFGQPHSDGDGYKVDAEWVIEFETGIVATIYNYKDGPNYLGRQGLPVQKITNWHVGGRDRRAVTCVCSALGTDQYKLIG